MYSRDSSVLWTELNGQVMFMNIEKGAYYEAVGLGGMIWRLLEQPRSATDIVAHIVQQYRVEAEECAKDVQRFLDKMVAANLLTCDEDALHGGSSITDRG